MNGSSRIYTFSTIGAKCLVLGYENCERNINFFPKADNIQGGREVSAILLTVVGAVERTKNICIIWGLNLIVFSEKVFLVLFCSRPTAYIVRDNAKKIYISRGLILFSKIFYVFDVVYVKSNRISC